MVCLFTLVSCVWVCFECVGVCVACGFLVFYSSLFFLVVYFEEREYEVGWIGGREDLRGIGG